jgi:aminobenzoyl-glutamate transport protein
MNRMMKFFDKKNYNLNLMHMVERVGNALPHPAALFGLFAGFTLVFSGVGHWLGWNGIHPATGELVEVINFFVKKFHHSIHIFWKQIIQKDRIRNKPDTLCNKLRPF